jgi:hypothetical protein
MHSKRTLYENRNYNFNTKLHNCMEYKNHLNKLVEIGKRENKYKHQTSTSSRNNSRNVISLTKLTYDPDYVRKKNTSFYTNIHKIDSRSLDKKSILVSIYLYRINTHRGIQMAFSGRSQTRRLGIQGKKR